MIFVETSKNQIYYPHNFIARPNILHRKHLNTIGIIGLSSLDISKDFVEIQRRRNPQQQRNDSDSDSDSSVLSKDILDSEFPVSPRKPPTIRPVAGETSNIKLDQAAIEQILKYITRVRVTNKTLYEADIEFGKLDTLTQVTMELKENIYIKK